MCQAKGNIMKIIRIFLVISLFVFGGCVLDDPSPEQLELQAQAGQAELPTITIINESTINISIRYMPDEDVTVEAVILAGSAYEVESGVTEVFINGGTLSF
jgi:hypothetical protein